MREGISNTILEAMASGLPVVATRVGGNPELVVDGETGLLVPPADPVAMAAAVRTYFLEASQLARHGEAGRKRAVAQFGIGAMVSGYLTLYDAVLARRSC
jgi:glycosyltransferase involved in cell wall biosynthesis